jgi:proline iminopeptidase
MQMHRDLLPLSTRRVVIYYDQRGGGRSELPTDTTALTMAHHVADLEALRQHFRLERLTVFGHSFGPALAASYALAHPTRVARMIFVGPVPPRRGAFFGEYGANMASRMDSAALARMNRLGGEIATSADPVATCREFWRLGMPPRMAEPARASELREDPCDAPPEALRYASRHVGAAAFRSLGAWDWREGLRSVTAPTLILHGEQELIPMRLVEEWTQALPNARLVRIPGAGHFPFVERPDVFYPALDAFLAEQ